METAVCGHNQPSQAQGQQCAESVNEQHEQQRACGGTAKAQSGEHERIVVIIIVVVFVIINDKNSTAW